MNEQGINVIRSFPGRGIRVWGARSLAAADDSQEQWWFIHVRRTLSMIEDSVEKSMQWTVFETNNDTLRSTLTHSLTVLLEQIWQSGGLKGARAGQAFYVICNDTNNPQSQIDNGLAGVRGGRGDRGADGVPDLPGPAAPRRDRRGGGLAHGIESQRTAGAFNFYVTLLDSSNLLGTLLNAAFNYAVAGFFECSGLDVTLEVMEYKEGGVNEYVHKFVTRASHANLTLKRGIIFLEDELWTWHQDFVQGAGSARTD